MIRAAVLSDTHYRGRYIDPDLRKAISRYDHMIHAGDFVNEHIITDLLSFGSFWGVAGNNDPDGIRKILGRKKIIEIDGVKIGLHHGDGTWLHPLEHSRRAFCGENVDAVIFGHTHRPVILKEDGVLYINPGSATLPRGGSERTFALLAINNGEMSAELIEIGSDNG